MSSRLIVPTKRIRPQSYLKVWNGAMEGLRGRNITPTLMKVMKALRKDAEGLG